MNAVVVWFELTMLPPEEEEEGGGGGGGGGVLTLSTGPEAQPRSHWKQMLFYLPPTHPHGGAVEEGEVVRLQVAYDKERLRVVVAGKE